MCPFHRIFVLLNQKIVLLNHEVAQKNSVLSFLSVDLQCHFRPYNLFITMDEEYVINGAAWDKLDQALFTSSLITEEEHKRGRLEDEQHMYPISRKETEQMEQLLNEAEELADDPNEENYVERLSMLRNVVDWSKSRHKSWSVKVIIGALISAWLLNGAEKKGVEDIESAKKTVEAVQAWDSTEVALNVGNVSAEWKDKHSDERLNSPKQYKMYELSLIKMYQKGQEEEAVRIQAMADTTKDAELKQRRLESVEECKAKALKYKAEYDSVSSLNSAQIREMALGRLNRSLNIKTGTAKTMHGFWIFLCVLIPLYIISGYPRGYNLIRSYVRGGCLGAFRKVGFGLASFFFGFGLAMSLLPNDIVKYIYSDGHTETRNEGNIFNIPIMLCKLGMMCIGAILFVIVSTFIMIFETIGGLRRNLDWGAIFRILIPKKPQPEAQHNA